MYGPINHRESCRRQLFEVGNISITAAAGGRGGRAARAANGNARRERESIERYVLTSVKRDVERRDRGLESGPRTERRNTEIIAVYKILRNFTQLDCSLVLRVFSSFLRSHGAVSR